MSCRTSSSGVFSLRLARTKKPPGHWPAFECSTMFLPLRPQRIFRPSQRLRVHLWQIEVSDLVLAGIGCNRGIYTLSEHMIGAIRNSLLYNCRVEGPSA